MAWRQNPLSAKTKLDMRMDDGHEIQSITSKNDFLLQLLIFDVLCLLFTFVIPIVGTLICSKGKVYVWILPLLVLLINHVLILIKAHKHLVIHLNGIVIKCRLVHLICIHVIRRVDHLACPARPFKWSLCDIISWQHFPWRIHRLFLQSPPFAGWQHRFWRLIDDQRIIPEPRAPIVGHDLGNKMLLLFLVYPVQLRLCIALLHRNKNFVTFHVGINIPRQHFSFFPILGKLKRLLRRRLLIYQGVSQVIKNFQFVVVKRQWVFSFLIPLQLVGQNFSDATVCHHLSPSRLRGTRKSSRGCGCARDRRITTGICTNYVEGMGATSICHTLWHSSSRA
mmetsp:Transcript_40896/g.66323  ORF Transcript_40896/g.66323 Transcript_40896/m.66323 type:complete len:337 (-) Transcript_40896:217-1227(-)